MELGTHTVSLPFTRSGSSASAVLKLLSAIDCFAKVLPAIDGLAGIPMTRTGPSTRLGGAAEEPLDCSFRCRQAGGGESTTAQRSTTRCRVAGAIHWEVTDSEAKLCLEAADTRDGGQGVKRCGVGLSRRWIRNGRAEGNCARQHPSRNFLRASASSCVAAVSAVIP